MCDLRQFFYHDYLHSNSYKLLLASSIPPSTLLLMFINVSRKEWFHFEKSFQFVSPPIQKNVKDV